MSDIQQHSGNQNASPGHPKSRLSEASVANIIIAIIGLVSAVAVAALTSWAAVRASGGKVGQLESQVQKARTAISSIGVPSGTIIAFGGEPNLARLKENGWLICDGSQVAVAEYPELFAAIGYSWGKGDGADSFRLPDLRGLFLRGVDAGGKHDADVSKRTAIAPGGNQTNRVGSFQADGIPSHSHEFDLATFGETEQQGDNSRHFVPKGIRINGNPVKNPTLGVPEGAVRETRPKNAYVHYLVRF